MAKEKNLKKIIVIEDDCQPINDFENRLNKINNFLDHSDVWNIFIGGVNYTDVNNIIRKIDTEIDCLIEINYGTMTHFMIYNQNMYDIILDLDYNNVKIDNFWHYKYPVIIPLPFIAWQYGDISDIYHVDMTRKYGMYLKKTQSQLLTYLNQ